MQVFISAAFLLTFLIPILGWAEQKPLPSAYTCGVVASLSGPVAEWGLEIRNAIMLAQEDLHDTSVKFIFEDDQYIPKNTVAAVQKLLTLDRVNCLITFGSSTTMAVQERAESLKIPLFAMALNPKIGQGMSYVYRYQISAKRESEVIASEIQRRKYQRVASITSTHEATLALRDALMKKETYKPVLSEELPVGELELAGLAMRIIKAQPDAVLLNLVPPQPSTLARKLRELGYKGDFFSGALIETHDEIVAAKGALEGAWFATVAKTNAQPVNARYEQRFGKRPGSLLIYAYDLAKLIMLGSATGDLLGYVHDLRSFEGLAGNYGWDGTEFDIPVTNWVIHDDRFELLQ